MSIDEVRLKLLIDEDDIKKAITKYSRGLDRHDENLIASAFHSNAVDIHGDEPRDIPEFIEWGNRLHSTHTRSHQHFLATQTIEVDGDTAHAETYVLFALWRQQDELVDLSGGRYIDRLERRDGIWAISERVMLLDWSSEIAQGTDVKSTLARYQRGHWSSADLSYRRPLAWDEGEAAMPNNRFDSLLNPEDHRD
ncbi:nuclear transport factor 2 family protein [Homoserinimonas sp. A520]